MKLDPFENDARAKLPKDSAHIFEKLSSGLAQRGPFPWSLNSLATFQHAAKATMSQASDLDKFPNMYFGKPDELAFTWPHHRCIRFVVVRAGLLLRARRYATALREENAV